MLLDELINYVNTTDDYPLVIAAVVQYQLVTIYPFEEGNGRSRREFVRCLALHNGYVINFVNAGKDEMSEAGRESFLCG